MRIGKTFKFEAAHHLPNHDGKCRRPHGHSYVVEVVIRGDRHRVGSGSSEGMVMDFSVVSEAFRRRVFDRLDHQDLNVVLADEVAVTTAEELARWIFGEMADELDQADNMRIVESVKVWETATSWAMIAMDNVGDLYQ